MNGALFVAFVAASLVLAATPGPGVMYVVARTLAQGRRAGLVSVLGVALGNLGNALGAALGLAALFAVSAAAFTVVKLAGAAYLVWLGVQALRRPAAQPSDGLTPEFHAPVLSRIFRDGFWVALLNPKTAIFFAAFLPQFIDPAHSAIAQSVMFGAVFVAIAVCTDSAYVFAAALVQPRLARLRGGGAGAALGRWLTGTVFIGLGLFTACTGSRSTR